MLFSTSLSTSIETVGEVWKLRGSVEGGVTSTRGSLCVAISILEVLVSVFVVCWSQGLALSNFGVDRDFGCGTTSSAWEVHGDLRRPSKLVVSSSFPDIFALDVTEFLFGDCGFQVLVSSILVIICGLVTASSRVFRRARIIYRETSCPTRLPEKSLTTPIGFTSPLPALCVLPKVGICFLFLFLRSPPFLYWFGIYPPS